MASYKIGYAQCSEVISFHQAVLRGLLKAAEQHPEVELAVRNNELDNERTATNVKEFVDLKMDAVIICHVDERTAMDIIKPLRDALIPVIALEIPIPLTTYFGIDNKQAGLLAGDALAEWIEKNWEGKVDKVLALTDYRFTSFIRARMEGAINGLTKKLPIPQDNILQFQGDSNYDGAMKNSHPILERWGKDSKVAIIGNNDDAAMGALDAAKELGFGENVVGVGFGATLTEREFANPESRFVASATFDPELYGEPMLALAIEAAKKERVKPQNFVQPGIVKRWEQAAPVEADPAAETKPAPPAEETKPAAPTEETPAAESETPPAE